MAKEKYIRLTRERAPTRSAVAALSRSSLWLGSDHLLFVECTGYTEKYKRFYFRDIQAFTIRATAGRAIINGILSFLMVPCLLFCDYRALLAGQPGVGTIVLLCIVIFLLGIPLLANNLLGTTCACQIRTAVQTEDLPSLNRVDQTHKFLGKIRPYIAAAQGQLTPEEISVKMRRTISGEPSLQEPNSPWTTPPPPVIS